jgi:predicted PurR-regulated permease PerM
MIDRAEPERLARFAFYGTVFLLVWMMWKVVQPFVLEIGWAAVLAICLNPIRLRIEPRLGRTNAALVLVVAVLLLAVLPAVFVGYTLYAQGGTGVDYVQRKLQEEGGPMSLFHHVWEWMRARAPFLPEEQAVVSGISEGLGKVVQHVAGQASRILAGVIGFVFSVAIMLAILFFLIRDSAGFDRTLRRLMPFDPSRNAHFVALSSALVSASVTATLVIAAVQGIIGGITFALLGVPGSMLWGVITTILSFVPLIGAAIVWAPVAVWLAVTGHLVKAVVLALVGILVLSNVDNVVRPLLLAGKSQMNTLVLIISLMGGVAAFGFIGIVLGPLVTVLLTAILDSYYVRPDESLLAPAPAAEEAGRPGEAAQ